MNSLLTFNAVDVKAFSGEFFEGKDGQRKRQSADRGGENDCTPVTPRDKFAESYKVEEKFATDDKTQPVKQKSARLAAS